MTERIYYKDAYQTAFEARVERCKPTEGGYALILDRTAFYPEGGGQPCDLGVIIPSDMPCGSAADMPTDRPCEPVADVSADRPYKPAADMSADRPCGPVRVLDVQEKDGEVVHLTDGPVPVGSAVRGEIDWSRRLTHMREHSGEHILSGIICHAFDCSNVGFHMGKDFVTVDFSRALTEEEIRQAQRAANEKVLEDVEIRAEYPDAQTLQRLEYRSKKELTGDIRIVTVPGADCCACCGTHVRRTGEVGPIRVIGSEHFRGGIRLNVLIGEKALADYEMRSENTAAISALLSVKPDRTAEAVEKLQKAMNALRLEYGALKMKLLEQKAEAVRDGQAACVLFEQDLTAVEARKLADRLREKTGFAAVFCGDDQKGYQYVIISETVDVSAFGREFNRALNGRGGGHSPMIQGSLCAKREEIEGFLRERGLSED